LLRENAVAGQEGPVYRVFEIAAFTSPPCLPAGAGRGVLQHFRKKKETPSKTWSLFFIQLNEFLV